MELTAAKQTNCKKPRQEKKLKYSISDTLKSLKNILPYIYTAHPHLQAAFLFAKRQGAAQIPRNVPDHLDPVPSARCRPAWIFLSSGLPCGT